MPVLFIDSFDHWDATNLGVNAKWTAAGGVVPFHQNIPGAARNGPLGCRFPFLANFLRHSGSTTTYGFQRTIGAAVRFPTIPSISSNLLRIQLHLGGTIDVRVNPTGSITLQQDSASAFTPVTNILDGNWHYAELMGKPHAGSTGADKWEFRLDGVTLLSSNQTVPDPDPGIYTYIEAYLYATVNNIDFDDAYVTYGTTFNDTHTTDSFGGDMAMGVIYPIADSGLAAHDQWLTSLAQPAFQYVDDKPPATPIPTEGPLGDDKMFITTAPAGSRFQLFTMQTAASPPLTAKVVQYVATCRKAGTGADVAGSNVYMRRSGAGVETTSPAFTFFTANFQFRPIIFPLIDVSIPSYINEAGATYGLRSEAPAAGQKDVSQFLIELASAPEPPPVTFPEIRVTQYVLEIAVPVVEPPPPPPPPPPPEAGSQWVYEHGLATLTSLGKLKTDGSTDMTPGSWTFESAVMIRESLGKLRKRNL